MTTEPITKPITAKQAWDTLSRVDCRDKIEKKGGLSYLSWAWAWGILMEHFPESTYEFLPEQTFGDGSMEVAVIVTIGACQRKMTLPVMDHRNNSIINPSSRQVNDARMRCLVKCLALFGLGHFIYAGEDLPMSSPITSEQAASLKFQLEELKADVTAFCRKFRVASVDELPASDFANAQRALDAKRKQLADAINGSQGAAA